MPGLDYDDTFNTVLRFAPCQQRVCENISIVQDSCVVEQDEDFLIFLERIVDNGFIQTNRINLETTASRIIISDDDGQFISLFTN